MPLSSRPPKASWAITIFLIILFCLGCNEDTSNPSDGDLDALDGDADSEYATEEESESLEDAETGDQDLEQEDAIACDFTDPYCDGEDILSCVDGSESRTTCEDGSYCNYAACQESTVVFPIDAGFHTERSEWWYYTGHLSQGDHRWGFEVTIFQYDMQALFDMPGDGYMCHVAITDKQAGEHYHTDSLALNPITWTIDPYILELDNCRFELGGDGRDHIYGIIPEGKEKDDKASPWEIELSFEPQKRVTLHGGDGIIPMSAAGGTSWYYSYTRLAASGTLSTPDGEFQVEGQGWMDHQWGEFDIVEFKGWDWWSMQFEDGYEIMLFQFTGWDGELASQAGTITDPDGNLSELEGFEDFNITPIRTWDSPHTDGVYPLDWDISIAEMEWQLEVRVTIDDQEMYNIAQSYWEGNTILSGTRSGEPVSGAGYTELTGYASDYLDPKP